MMLTRTCPLVVLPIRTSPLVVLLYEPPRSVSTEHTNLPRSYPHARVTGYEPPRSYHHMLTAIHEPTRSWHNISRSKYSIIAKTQHNTSHSLLDFRLAQHQAPPGETSPDCLAVQSSSPGARLARNPCSLRYRLAVTPYHQAPLSHRPIVVASTAWRIISSQNRLTNLPNSPIRCYLNFIEQPLASLSPNGKHSAARRFYLLELTPIKPLLTLEHMITDFYTRLISYQQCTQYDLRTHNEFRTHNIETTQKECEQCRVAWQ
ncbi:hypothetical protein DEO72_LG3g2525 [Vigna unguiculata]|uniref:Uncharacterized protein n=1 Tax=Vigna unguiculata TaxID=3917 RepID=A0A4D6LI19_VIGUN|nr:hypothetical protein DEO72_LG3g2525 [Vigna unguiculata]